MRRLLAALAAATLTLAIAAPVYATSTVGGGSFAGTAGDGAYYDPDYQSANADVFVDWVRMLQRCSQDTCGGKIHARVTVGNLPDYAGSNTCIQVVLDWDTPDGSPGGHYDSRMVRDCKPNSTWYMSTSDGFEEPNPECLAPIGPELYTYCDMPMGRVQIARFVPSTQNVIDVSKECWYRESGHTLADCQAWEPTCPFDKWACRGWILNRDGSHTIRDGGVVTRPFWRHPYQ